jgi:hypothetical protein
MNVSLSIDTKELQKLQLGISILSEKNIRYSVANAMTQSSKAAQRALQAQMPRYIRGGPVPFTRNSTYVRFAKPTDLSTEVGFKQFAPKGTPAGRYLQPMAGGGPRVAKSTERQLRNAGLIPSNAFIVPADVTPLRLNTYGNLTGGTYTQVLSRLKALNTDGSSENVSGDARSQAKRSKRDYFIGRPGGLPLGIYAYVGRKPKGRGGKGTVKGGRPMTTGLPRGFHTVFYVTKQPQYQPTFPIRKILEGTFNNTYARNIRASIEEAIAFRTNRGR